MTLPQLFAESVAFTLLAAPCIAYAQPAGHQQGTPVNCGDNLNVAGGDYILTNDLVCFTDPAVQITADNIRFNLKGFTIRGYGGTGILIPVSSEGYAQRRGIHLEGGTVTGFATCIDVTAYSSRVNRMVISGCREAGRASGGIGLKILGSDNVVDHNTLSNNEVGIAQNGASTLFYENSITRNGLGIRLAGSGRDILLANSVSHNTGVGIEIQKSSVDIDLPTSGNSRLEKNVVSNNGWGIRVTNSSAFPTEADRIFDNTVVGNRKYGVALNQQGYGVVTENTVLRNGTFDLWDFAPQSQDGSCRNTWLRNKFSTSNLSSCIPVQKAMPVKCGDELNVPGGDYILTSDLVCSVDPAVRITADNIRFNLNGFTMRGSGGTGILVPEPFHGGPCAGQPCAGLHIVGGTLTGFGNGIDMFTRHARVNRMTFSRIRSLGEFGYGNAIKTSYGSYNVYEQNTFRDNDRSISESGYNHLVYLNLVENNGGGISTYGGGVVLSNYISRNGGAGIEVSSNYSSNQNLVQNCVLRDNGSGIIAHNSGATIRNNIITGSKVYGIEMSQSEFGTVTENTSLRNGLYDLWDYYVTIGFPSSPGYCGSTWLRNIFETSNNSESITDCIH